LQKITPVKGETLTHWHFFRHPELVSGSKRENAGMDAETSSA
jgi:hypothetical protein